MIQVRMSIYVAIFTLIPFQATRVLKPVWTSLDQPPTIQSTPGEKLIWETRKTPLRHVLGEPNIINNIVLNLTRPGSSSYLGFGEQGGRSLLKDPSFMNYYCGSIVS